MDTQALKSPLVRQFVETINERRVDDFLALFVADAVVIDGPTYQGSAAIRTWAQEETFDMQLHVDAVQEMDATGLVVAVQATLQGGLI